MVGQFVLFVVVPYPDISLFSEKLKVGERLNCINVTKVNFYFLLFFKIYYFLCGANTQESNLRVVVNEDFKIS